MKRMLIVVCAGVLAASFAATHVQAQPKTADDWEKVGENEYNLGNFDKAAEAFKKGFETEPVEAKKPAYLYNVAQAYRQGNDCKNAKFFYKRFLDLKEQDRVKPLSESKRAEVEGFISALEECARKQEQASAKSPTGTTSPNASDPTTKTDGGSAQGSASTGSGAGSGTRVAGSGDGEDDDTDRMSVVKPASHPPKIISVRLLGGASKISDGKNPFPVQATGELIAGYPLALAPKFILELGGAFSFTPVPYNIGSTTMTHTAQFVSAMVNVGATYEVIPKLNIRGDLGAGLLVFSGIEEQNPFTTMGMGTSGALSMPHVRIGISADYAFTPNIYGVVAPFAFSYSPPKEGLDDQIKSIVRLDFMVGIGYRM